MMKGLLSWECLSNPPDSLERSKFIANHLCSDCGPCNMNLEKAKMKKRKYQIVMLFSKETRQLMNVNERMIRAMSTNMRMFQSSLQGEPKVGSVELCKMFWYPEALKVPFTGNKGPSPTPENNPTT